MADTAADVAWDRWADDQEAHAPSLTVTDGDTVHELTVTRLSRLWEATCSCGCLDDRPVPIFARDSHDALSDAEQHVRAGIDGPLS